MTPKQFDKAAVKLFDPVLAKHGFTSDGSDSCTFHRRVDDEIYHFIMPDIGSRGAWYDIKVFPASPVLDPLFHERFPDSIGIPTDTFSYLSKQGVGMEQEQFNCKSVENFERRFGLTVRGLLTHRAIPYLDQIQTIEDMIRVIRNPAHLGIALHHVGRVDEARPILLKQRERLGLLGSSERVVTARLQLMDDLLSAGRGRS